MLLCYAEDPALLVKDHTFRLLEIGSVDEIQGRKIKGKDDISTMKSEIGLQKHAFINVTSDF